MKAAWTSETLVTCHTTTRRNNTEDLDFNQWLEFSKSKNAFQVHYTFSPKSFVIPFHIKKLKIKIYKTVILPEVLHGCETWSLALMEERRLRVFENFELGLSRKGGT
jgi:hypothetical protein